MIFFNQVFAKEGDIFEGSSCGWEAMKELLLKGIFEAVQELESFAILDVPDKVISRVTRVVCATEKSGVRVDWLDRVIGEVARGVITLSWRTKRAVCRTRLPNFVRNWVELRNSWG